MTTVRISRTGYFFVGATRYKVIKVLPGCYHVRRFNKVTKEWTIDCGRFAGLRAVRMAIAAGKFPGAEKAVVTKNVTDEGPR